MSYEQFKTAIRQISDISDEECDIFKDTLRSLTYDKNEHLIKAGQVCNSINFVVKGLCRMYYLQDGKEINNCFFFENQFLAEYSSFLGQAPSRYYIQALEDTEVISFSYESVENSYDKSHAWERFGRKVAEYCYLNACSRTESFLFLNGEQRYLQLLEDSPWYFDRIPLYHIASFLGLERETLSRLRKKIASHDLL